jgi:hypothetical protein
MIFHPRAIMSLLTAHIAALAVSSTSNEVLAENINLDHAIAGSASVSRRSLRTETRAECSFVASPETPEKDAEMDVGILINPCAEYEKCVKDETSSLGGRCVMFGAEEGFTKVHRDLSGACSGTPFPNDCIPCTMQNGTAGKKCDWDQACNGVDTTKVSCGSCNGPSACENAAGTIGESSCNTYKACLGLTAAATIGENSCNGGTEACFEAAGTIGKSSCNGRGACLRLKAAGTIGQSSCNSDYTCNYATGPIGGSSCNNDFACTNAGPIGKSSCNSKLACSQATGPIGESSCNGYKSCFLALGPIGESSCNDDRACYKQISKLIVYSSIKFTNLAQDNIITL